MGDNKKVLFHTENVDDEMFMCSDLRINKTFKDGLEFEHERQNAGIETFTVYKRGVKKLNQFLAKWLEESK